MVSLPSIGVNYQHLRLLLLHRSSNHCPAPLRCSGFSDVAVDQLSLVAVGIELASFAQTVVCSGWGLVARVSGGDSEYCLMKRAEEV